MRDECVRTHNPRHSVPERACKPLIRTDSFGSAGSVRSEIPLVRSVHMCPAGRPLEWQAAGLEAS